MNKRGFIDEYREELRHVWKDDHMIDYCVKCADNVVRLDNGYLIPIEKESIKRHFCFGYSDSRYDTEDYDRANEMASYARTSEDYFFEENMKSFRSMMDALNDSNYHPCAMYSYSENANIKGIRLYKGWEICDLFGGSCYMDEVGGKTVKHNGYDVYIMNDKDIEDVKKGYELAMKNHEKRVRTYLKKYGTKHVESWSYWRDE